MAPSENWHLDKKVPISIITAICVQSMAFIYIGTAWKTDVEGRIANLEKSDSGQASHENRLVVLEQQFSFIRSDLAEIKTLLRRHPPPPENSQQ